MKITEAKFRNSVAMPDTSVGNSERVVSSKEVELTLVKETRCLSIKKTGFPKVTLVPLEQVAWMKFEEK